LSTEKRNAPGSLSSIVSSAIASIGSQPPLGRRDGHSLGATPGRTFQPDPPDVTGKSTKDGRNQWLSKFFCETKISDLALVMFTYGLLVATGWLVWATLKMWAAGERQGRHSRKTCERRAARG
jgi:hypothetical protein